MHYFVQLREIAGLRPIKSDSPQNLASSDIGSRLTSVGGDKLSSFLFCGYAKISLSDPKKSIV